MIVNKLKEILNSNDSDRIKLIMEFQDEIFRDEVDQYGSNYEMLADLAYDLAYYEPDIKARRQDASFYGDERLREEINTVLEKLNRS